MTESPFRLPRTVVPDHYDITLDVDPARDTFAGSQNLERLDANVRLRARQTPAVTAYFAS